MFSFATIRVPCDFRLTIHPHPLSFPMSTRCFCDTCNGSLVSRQTKLNHQRKQLKNEMISQQIHRKDEDLPATQQVAGPSSFISHHPSPYVSGPLDTSDSNGEPGSRGLVGHNFVSVMEDDVFMDVIYDTIPEILPDAVNINQQDRDGEYVLDNQEEEVLHKDDIDFPDEDLNAPEVPEDRGTAALSLTDSLGTNPFVIEHYADPSNHREPEVLEHLLVMYAIIGWLYFQFHLPRVACNAVLAFLACLLRFFNPTATSP